jgi:hypothetical protein
MSAENGIVYNIVPHPTVKSRFKEYNFNAIAEAMEMNETQTTKHKPTRSDNKKANKDDEIVESLADDNASGVKPRTSNQTLL